MAVQQVRPKAVQRGGISPLTMLLLFPLFIGGLLLLPTSILIFTGMLPTLACLLIDKDSQRYTTITVGLMNMAGVIPHLVRLWLLGESMDHLVNILANPISWLTMYGTATFGWLLYFVIPPILQTLINQKLKLNIISLEHKQAGMIREWGDEIRIGEPAPPSGA